MGSLLRGNGMSFNGSVKRGTTPTHVFRLNINLTGCTIYITYKQRGEVIVEKTGNDISVEQVTSSSCLLKTTLTQEETLKFDIDSANCEKVKVQIRYKREDGFADASDVMEFSVGEILKEGVI